MIDYEPFPDTSTKPRTWVWDIPLDGETITEFPIEPEEIAMYVHCMSGVSPMEFVAWLTDQLVTLDAINPECSK